MVTENSFKTALQGGLLSTIELTVLGQVCDRVRVEQQTTSRQNMKVSDAIKRI